MSRDCPTAGGGPDGKCFKVISKLFFNSFKFVVFLMLFFPQCHETGHMSKDCPNPFSNVTEDGKPREAYIPQEITDENELFQGIKSGSAFDNFDRVALQVSKFCKMFYLQLTYVFLFGHFRLRDKIVPSIFRRSRKLDCANLCWITSKGRGMLSQLLFRKEPFLLSWPKET